MRREPSGCCACRATVLRWTPAEIDALLQSDTHGLRASADSPRAGADDLRAGADDLRVGAEVVVVPDRHGTDINGLLLTPPAVIAPSFGPDSRERHRALAAAAGARWRIEQLASLPLDVDTGEDLAGVARAPRG